MPANKTPRDRDRDRDRHARRAESASLRVPGITPGEDLPVPPSAMGEYTGRYVVLFREDATDEGARLLTKTLGVRAAEPGPEGFFGTAEVVFPEIGAAVTPMEPGAMSELSAASAAGGRVIEAIEPERVVYALGAVAIEPAAPRTTPEYLRGFRDGVNSLVASLGNGTVAGGAPGAVLEAPVVDESQATWGLQVTGVTRSRFTGRGVRIAVLDTGFGPHPDFAGRKVTAASFVPNEPPRDVQGHGTHCVGTAAGPLRPAGGPRYGCAPDGELFVGKVLNDAGFGTSGSILAGIDWAVRNRCDIISMSLGARVAPGQPHDTVFEGVARRVLRRGTLICAAAGNESRRREGRVAPVGHPANCPSILAVAAVDLRFMMAWFSNGAVNPNGGEVDIAGPGVDVYSSYPKLQPGLGLYRMLSGTSMATPHVAGIAALWAEATGQRGRALWDLLVSRARHLNGLPPSDVGAGLVQAP